MATDLTSIHPELVKTAQSLPALRYSSKTLPGLRLLFAAVFFLRKTRPGVRVETHGIQTGEPPSRVQLRLYKPRGAAGPVPVLVWFHGGGHVVGNLNMSDAQLLKYVQDLGIAVVSVGYRLAPEHPFPADLDDAYAALTWIHGRAASLGFDPNRIAVGGESAGGGIAAALTHRSYDRGGVQPVFQLLIYPMLDDRTGSKPGEPEKDYLVWTPASNRFAWEAYLQQPPGSPTVPAGSVPARRADLRGLPPAWIGVGTNDLFHEETVAYAKRLQACGVGCELVVVPGAFHGFDAASPQAPVSREFYRAQVEELRKHLLAQPRRDTVRFP